MDEGKALMGAGGRNTGSAERERRFRDLHERTYADLLRFVERRISPSEAEDVVATVFLTAWRRLDDVPEDARPWLFAVARRTMVNQVRGVWRRRALDVRVAAQGEPVEADGSAGTAVRLDLVRAWRTLRPADREVLALAAFDDLTSEQAARVLGCRPTAYTTRLSRARKRLQAALEPTRATVEEKIKEQAWS
ncbi:RNA polymerase sigma factor [Micromonospora sp. NPDC049559]|uniref:RNA polymerase sigma factor n=1 Tax=Micromonospora sp. NPDC049559 TaxID=3155923 RepID=UPI00341AC521